MQQHQAQNHQSKSKVINIIRTNVIRQAIEEPDEIIDFGNEETLLQDQRVP